MGASTLFIDNITDMFFLPRTRAAVEDLGYVRFSAKSSSTDYSQAV